MDTGRSVSPLAYMASYDVRPKCRKLTGLTSSAFVIMGDEIRRKVEATMGNIYLETVVQVVAIVGGVVALMLAGLQAAETWLDISEKLKKRRRGKCDKPWPATHKVHFITTKSDDCHVRYVLRYANLSESE